ncbi:MAG: two-component system LytT family response regulator [Halioglobus sp.]|jgi:two-component system LytT family response regulator
MNAVIIDDEVMALDSLEYDIKTYCPEIKIIGKFDNPEEAILFIDKHEPDIVMTDIQMPRMDAFRMLDQLAFTDFELILVTAYNKYAVRAFEFSAVDYIVKPIEPDKLRQAVIKAQEKKKSNDLEQRLSLILHNIKFGNKENHTLAIPTLEGAEFIEIDDIIHCKADANYCNIHISTGEKLVVSKPLKHFADLLTERGFIRVHQSHLINTAYIRSYRKGSAGSLILKDGTIIPISKSYKRNLNEFMTGRPS